MKTLKEYILEGKEVSLSELQKFADKAVQELKDGSNSTFYKLLGDSTCETGKMYLVIGWGDGFEEETKEENELADGSYRICMKLAYNCDDLQYDFESDWEMPYDKETGDVDDTCSEYDEGDVKYLYDYWKKNYKK